MTDRSLTVIEYSKTCMDVGIFSDARLCAAMTSFAAANLPLVLDKTVETDAGSHEHRYRAAESFVKVNCVGGRDLPESTSGIRTILLASTTVERAKDLTDPAGNRYKLVPHGTDGITDLAVEMFSASSPCPLEAALMDVYGERARGPRNEVRIGTTVLRYGTGGGRSTTPLESRGITYLTLHVRNIEAVWDRLIAAGYRSVVPLTRFRDVTIFGFLRDSDGNWLELSRRADLCGGSLPDIGSGLDQAEVTRLLCE